MTTAILFGSPAATGPRTTHSGSGALNNSLHYSTCTNDYATLSFEGTQFMRTDTGYANRGQMTVLVDDVNVGMLYQYYAFLASQKT
jgi:hypothetical protein